MTKIQRRKIYEKVLWCIGDDDIATESGCIIGVCCLLADLIKPDRGGLIEGCAWYEWIEKQFPEFTKQKPKHAKGIWWSFTPQGNRKRRLALEKAIQLTY